MKLTVAQLPLHLKKQLAPVYLISGDDLFLKKDTLTQILTAARAQGFSEKVRLIVEPGFDWGQVYILLNSTSFFTETQLIELDCRHSLPTKEGCDTLIEYSQSPRRDLILIVNLGKLEQKTQKSKWFSALEKIGISIPIWPISNDQLPKWVMDQAKKYQMTLLPEAVRLLSSSIEGNLAAAAQMIEKISLLNPTQPIDQNIIAQVLHDDSHFNVFDFTDALLAGQTLKTLRILQHLKETGTEPTLVLWSILRELRLMADLALELQAGNSFDAICQKNRIFFKRQQAVRYFLRHHSPVTCWQKLCEAEKIDHLIKGVTAGNVWSALVDYCLKIQNTSAPSM